MVNARKDRGRSGRLPVQATVFVVAKRMPVSLSSLVSYSMRASPMGTVVEHLAVPWLLVHRHLQAMVGDLYMPVEALRESSRRPWWRYVNLKLLKGGT